jgi:hypothetical protein
LWPFDPAPKQGARSLARHGPGHLPGWGAATETKEPCGNHSLDHGATTRSRPRHVFAPPSTDDHTQLLALLHGPSTVAAGSSAATVRVSWGSTPTPLRAAVAGPPRLGVHIQRRLIKPRAWGVTRRRQRPQRLVWILLCQVQEAADWPRLVAKHQPAGGAGAEQPLRVGEHEEAHDPPPPDNWWRCPRDPLTFPGSNNAPDPCLLS